MSFVDANEVKAKARGKVVRFVDGSARDTDSRIYFAFLILSYSVQRTASANTRYLQYAVFVSGCATSVT